MTFSGASEHFGQNPKCSSERNKLLFCCSDIPHLWSAHHLQ